PGIADLCSTGACLRVEASCSCCCLRCTRRTRRPELYSSVPAFRVESTSCLEELALQELPYPRRSPRCRSKSAVAGYSDRCSISRGTQMTRCKPHAPPYSHRSDVQW